MKFQLTIDSRNAAMCGAGRSEVARLLREAAAQVETRDDLLLVDANGHRCGSWCMDDERPDIENAEASELFEIADDLAVALDNDPRKLSRGRLISGLESVGCACFDDEGDALLADAYGDSMLAGDLDDGADTWRDACREAWEA